MSNRRRRLFPGTLQAAAPPVGLKVDLLCCLELDESTGPDVFDSYPPLHNFINDGIIPNDGTNNFATPNITGKLNTAYQFAGNDSIIKSAVAGDYLTPFFAGSISTWVKRLGAGTDASQYFNAKYVSNNGHRCFLFGMYATGDDRLRYSYYDTGNSATSIYYSPGSDIWTNEWRHIVMTRDGPDIDLYVDGSWVAAGSGGNGSIRSAVQSYDYVTMGGIMKSNTWGDNFFNGLIDQTAYWGRKITAPEVTQLWNGGAGLLFDNW